MSETEFETGAEQEQPREGEEPTAGAGEAEEAVETNDVSISDSGSASVEQTQSQIFKRSTHYKDAAKLLGRRIRELRKQNEWTLEVAADRMRIDLKHLQKIEAGSLNVTLVTLVRIARGLKVPVGMLFEKPVRDDSLDASKVFDFVKKKLKNR